MTPEHQADIKHRYRSNHFHTSFWFIFALFMAGFCMVIGSWLILLGLVELVAAGFILFLGWKIEGYIKKIADLYEQEDTIRAYLDKSGII